MASLGFNLPALIVVGISLVIGLLMVVVFRYTSDQKAIHIAKDHLKAHLLALAAFSGPDSGCDPLLWTHPAGDRTLSSAGVHAVACS